MLKTTRIVDADKPLKKTWWRLSEIEFDPLEKIIFRNMLNEGLGRKSVDDLKDLGNVKSKRNGGLMVEFDISEKRRASMLFGQRLGKYEYRDTLFFLNKIKEPYSDDM